MDDKAVREAPPIPAHLIESCQSVVWAAAWSVAQKSQAAELAEARERADRFHVRAEAYRKDAETAERRCAELVAERDSAYERGVRDGYEIRHNEVLAALA
jgi:hypothetical protein